MKTKHTPREHYYTERPKRNNILKTNILPTNKQDQNSGKHSN